MRSADTGRLRWVIWLLSAAVVIPSIGLLWLINHGLESERLVVRQRLEETYQHLGARVADSLADVWHQTYIHCRNLSLSSAELQPDGFMLLSPEGSILIPHRIPRESWGRQATDSPVFLQAWRQEFTEKNPEVAADTYQRIGDRQARVELRLAGRAAAVRCLVKAGDVTTAIERASVSLREITVDEADAVAQGIRLRLWMHSIELLLDARPQTAGTDVVALLNFMVDPDSPPVQENDRLLVFRRILARSQTLDVDPVLIARARRQYAAASLSSAQFPGSDDASGVLSRPREVLFPLNQASSVYGVLVDRTDTLALMLYQEDTIRAQVRRIAGQHLPPELLVQVTAPGQGPRPDLQRIGMVDQALNPMLPGWRLWGHMANDQALDAAAQRQTALFAWTGVLIIGLLVVAGATSIQLVNREIRFHRLKNDFVATVTHELKTPLASTRVLVDTLLENGGEDPQQRTEYLEMMARENVRLTSLIDRFLTFSRMERGKHGLVLETCEPADLVDRAVEAVQMHCRDAAAIQIEIESDLPEMAADPDALVTVLVNLLDNAIKYSGSDKQIRVRTFRRKGEMCFAVEDNGVGIPRRARKRVFSKFYQVDQSLSRSVGGCGLGLSIVDYIVRQHHGRIDVDSKVGAGSTFTVCLPLGTETL